MSETNRSQCNKALEHHKRQEYCRTRLEYRRGRQPKAVKVYTVANESQHLLVFGVPKINLKQELKRSFLRTGKLQLINCVTEELAKKVELEAFTDVFHLKYIKIEAARRAKRFMDAQQFYGGILHISYAPEYETLAELRCKLQQRKMEVEHRLLANARKQHLMQPTTALPNDATTSNTEN